MARGGGGGGGWRGGGSVVPIDSGGRDDEGDIEDDMIPRRRFGATLSRMGDDVGLGFIPVRRPFGRLRFPHFGDEPFSDEQTCDEHPPQHPHHHHHHHRDGHGGQPHGDVVIKPVLMPMTAGAGAPKKEGFFKRILKKIGAAFHGEDALEGELSIKHNPDGSVVMTHQPHGEFGGGFAASQYVGDRADFPNSPIIAADVPELAGTQHGLQTASGVPYGTHIHEIGIDYGTEYNPIKGGESAEDLLTTSGASYLAGSDLGCGLPSVGGQLKK